MAIIQTVWFIGRAAQSLIIMLTNYLIQIINNLFLKLQIKISLFLQLIYKILHYFILNLINIYWNIDTYKYKYVIMYL